MKPLCIFCPKISLNRRDLDKTTCVYFVIKGEQFLINIMKFGKKLAILSKEKNL